MDKIHVKGAFIHASLPESDKIHIFLPNIDDMQTEIRHVVELRKFFYGLRQVPKLWYKHIAETLCAIGFRRSSHCDCRFIRSSPSALIEFVEYVDD